MATVNKQAVAAAFGRAASGYTQHDELQRRCADLLLRQLARRDFAQVLDAGCGPGSMSRYWREAGSVVTALDLSAGMLAQAQRNDAAQHYLLGDIEALPLPDACVDLAWSNLAVQWCDDLRAAIGELYRVARPGGRVAFSTLLADSLPELNQAWQAIDDRPHANRFLSEAAVRAALSGLRATGEVHQISLPFADALSAMRSLKGIGATHLHQADRRPAWPRQTARAAAGLAAAAGHLPADVFSFTGVIERD